jgi:hypothetical protein
LTATALLPGAIVDGSTLQNALEPADWIMLHTWRASTRIRFQSLGDAIIIGATGK